MGFLKLTVIHRNLCCYPTLRICYKVYNVLIANFTPKLRGKQQCVT